MASISDNETNTIASNEKVSFVDLGMALYERLTGRGAAINYEFKEMLIEVPRDTGLEAPRATLRGHGQTLRLTIEKSRTLRSFFEISLPSSEVVGRAKLRPKDFPTLLTKQGLTLEIADSKELLLRLGKSAEGKRYMWPIIGRVSDVALAGVEAAARLALSY